MCSKTNITVATDNNLPYRGADVQTFKYLYIKKSFSLIVTLTNQIAQKLWPQTLLTNFSIRKEPFYSIYRKILNISPRLIVILKSNLGRLIFGGDYIRRAFCVSICYEDFKIYYHINKKAIPLAKKIFL